MAIIPKVLISPKILENTQTTQYNTPSSILGVYIDYVACKNLTDSPVTVTFNIVPSGGIVSLSNVIGPKTLAQNESYGFISELRSRFLSPGYSISTIASAADSVNLTITGREITV